MRNFFLFGLALVTFGAMAQSHVPRGLTAPSDVAIESVANITSGESFDSNAVEVDGIRFETLVSERVLTIPANQPGVETPVKLGIRITNNTPTPLRFNFFNALSPEIVAPHGQAVGRSHASDLLLEPKESDFPLVMPKQSVTFFQDAKLSWRKGGNQLTLDELALRVPDGIGGFWIFAALKPGTYQVRFRYESYRTTVVIPKPEIRRLDGVWTGQVVTTFMEVSLVQP